LVCDQVLTNAVYTVISTRFTIEAYEAEAGTRTTEPILSKATANILS
jgi:hypothetical protein